MAHFYLVSLCTSSEYFDIGSSRFNRPCSTSCISSVAPIGLETDAISYGVVRRRQNGVLDVGVAVGTRPHHPPVLDDRSREPRDGELGAKRAELPLERGSSRRAPEKNGGCKAGAEDPHAPRYGESLGRLARPAAAPASAAEAAARTTVAAAVVARTLVHRVLERLPLLLREHRSFGGDQSTCRSNVSSRSVRTRLAAVTIASDAGDSLSSVPRRSRIATSVSRVSRVTSSALWSFAI